MEQEKQVWQIRKRDGRIVPFEPKHITEAIRKAILAVGSGNGALAENLGKKVVHLVENRYAGRIPGVEEIQDVVEEVLVNEGYKDVAKAYILYRHKRAEVRAAKRFMAIQDELKLTVNAVRVLERRYLLKNEAGQTIETPAEMFRRVARAVAAVDARYDEKTDLSETEEQFYQLMANLEFLPNSPTLMNAGTDLGQLSACFVIPVEDSLYSIFTAVRAMSLIHQSGGGTGFSFSRLRPRGDVVRSTKGVASGPVSFMRVFDTATDVIRQGGRRRGANMGILRVDHPDILEFISAKSREGFLANFNLSVAVTDAFMRAVEKDEEYPLINPRTQKVVRKLRAQDVFDLIVANAWKTGDPGLIFIDEINRHNPTPHLGEIESTNPCGEQPLLPYESCNLGSINLSKMAHDGKLDWDKLERTIGVAVHFLDNVIDANRYILPEIEKITKNNRKIGLGVMGFADLLIQLGIPYDSEAAIATAEEVMSFISRAAREASAFWAERRGSFPNFQGSIYDKPSGSRVRNATVTTIAPTGTISVIAGCYSGIEPLFAVSFVRSVMEGAKLLEVNSLFEEMAKREGFYSPELMMGIAKEGSVQKIEEIPPSVRRIFVTALDIDPQWQVRIQAAFQKHTDNAVSKTVNLPQDASMEAVKKVYLLAHKLKCKGVTIYRYGSKEEQVLYIGSMGGKERGESLNYVGAESEYSGGCPAPVCTF